MVGTIVSRCRSCQAVVNVNWRSCVACQKPINKGIEPGCLIHWQSMDGVTSGPAVLQGTFDDQEKTWCWLTFKGIEFLINARLIVESTSAPESAEEGGLGQ